MANCDGTKFFGLYNFSLLKAGRRDAALDLNDETQM